MYCYIVHLMLHCSLLRTSCLRFLTKSPAVPQQLYKTASRSLSAIAELLVHFCKAGTLHFHFFGEKLDRVKTMDTHGRKLKYDEDKSKKIGRHVWIWIANKCAKFHAKGINQSENTVKILRRLLYFESPCILETFTSQRQYMHTGSLVEFGSPAFSHW